jgi:hypothetical protein
VRSPVVDDMPSPHACHPIVRTHGQAKAKF